MQNSNAVHQIDPRLRRFNTLIFSCATALLLCSALSFQARAQITIDFSNLTNTDISFSGGAFNFTSQSNGYQFNITSVTGGAGTSVGLKGYVSPGGPYTIGAITTNGSEQTAPVTGTGTLHITDSASHDLTGSVVWENITTFGVGGYINLTGMINLSGITYSGANSDLAALAAAGVAEDSVTFQFVPAQTLTQLATTGGETSYSGAITAVPEPGTLTLAAMGLVGLLAVARRRNK